MAGPGSNKGIMPLVLAVGAPQYFGASIQLAVAHGAPLVRHAVHNAETLCGNPPLRVVGHDWRTVLATTGPARGIVARTDLRRIARSAHS